MTQNGDDGLSCGIHTQRLYVLGLLDIFLAKEYLVHGLLVALQFFVPLVFLVVRIIAVGASVEAPT